MKVGDVECARNQKDPPFRAEHASLYNIHKKTYTWQELNDLPAKHPDDHLRFFPREGSFLWNTFSDKAAPHHRGCADLLTRKCVRVSGHKFDEVRELWCKSLGAGPDVMGWMCPATEALLTLTTWMWHRRPLWDRIFSMGLVDSSHFKNHNWQMENAWWATEKNSYWWRLALTDTDVGDRTVGWHATSMYCLQRIVAENGPREGFAENTVAGQPTSGVFYMRGPEAHCCENYLHWVMLDDDGWLFAPLLQLAVDEEMNSLMKTSSTKVPRGNNQRVADAEFVDLVAVYIHMVHITQVVLKPKACWIKAEPGFHRALEIDPDEPWDDVCARSKERRFITHG